MAKKKKARIEKKAVQIPEDVSVEILKRLAVKSLLRFRCVCQTWYALISDPDFCNKLHQKRAFVLISRTPRTFSTISVESLLMKGKNPVRHTPLPLPWEPRPMCTGSSQFLGSCNGLVCVYQTSDLILWNPSTRKFMRLPSTSRVHGNEYNEGRSGAFGHDGSKDDYKFVWMACNYKRRVVEFDVFSLKSKTWNSFDHRQPSDIILSNTDSCIRNRQYTGVFSNGAIHWMVCYNDRSSYRIRILALDLASEKYRLLETPQECGELCKKTVSLSEHLSDLWMMKEYYGVDSSLIKLASLPTSVSLPGRICLYTYHPIHFSSEEGSIVAMFESLSVGEGCEIMRLKVKNGAIISYRTLLTVLRSDATIVSEESLVSLN